MITGIKAFGVVVALAAAALFVAPACGAIVIDQAYSLGENDPGAVAGALGNSQTMDASGTNPLNLMLGTPTYRSDAAPGSSMSMEFGLNGESYYQGPLVSSYTNNFGAEIWVKTSTATGGDHVIFSAGNTATNGWSIFQQNNKWAFSYGSVIAVTGGTVNVGEWTHVAFVRDDGIGRLYVNGQVVGSTSASMVSPVGHTLLGSNEPGYTLRKPFCGEIDDAVIFHFSAGQFNAAADLNYPSVPEPATLSLLAMGALATLRKGRGQ